MVARASSVSTAPVTTTEGCGRDRKEPDALGRGLRLDRFTTYLPVKVSLYGPSR